MTLDTTIGGATADSYASLAEYVAYAASYGLTTTGDDAAKEVALRRARAYLDGGYKWSGVKVTVTQALAWPRVFDYLVDGFQVLSSEIPQDIKSAQCEMAAIIQGGADPFQAITAGAVVSLKEKIDVLEVDTKYKDSSARDRAAYPAVDQLVAPYVTGKAGQVFGSIGLARG